MIPTTKGDRRAPRFSSRAGLVRSWVHAWSVDPLLQATTAVRLMHEFEDLNPDVVCSVVAQCFGAAPRAEGAEAALMAERQARSMLEEYRSSHPDVLGGQ